MSIGIEPLGDMVLVQMEAAPEKTQSGLLLPEEAREAARLRRCRRLRKCGHTRALNLFSHLLQAGRLFSVC